MQPKCLERREIFLGCLSRKVSGLVGSSFTEGLGQIVVEGSIAFVACQA
jgi:hypothetical protein